MGISTADISGNIGLSNSISGLLNSARLSGNATMPKTVDRTAIHYETTATWNSMPSYVSLEGHIYIYSDYTVIEQGNETITIPAMKIGDGTTYLIDLPFVVETDYEREQAITNHLADSAIHVSGYDRTNWNSKIASRVYGDTLYFYS